MYSPIKYSKCPLLLQCVLFFYIVWVFLQDEPTALDDYVQGDDGFFSWTELDMYSFDDTEVDVYIVNMTSQKWMDGMFVNCLHTLYFGEWVKHSKSPSVFKSSWFLIVTFRVKIHLLAT